NRLFDEIRLILQSSRTMRPLRILLVLVIAAASRGLAQTNAPEIRKLSLDDCIAIAIQHNFDVQIRRYDPELARYTLSSQYGSYDPTFAASGGHSYNRAPGGIDPQGRPFGGTETDANNLSSSISGLLPWGTTYSLGGSMVDTYGHRPTIINGPITGFATNTVFDSLGNPIGFTTVPIFSATTVQEPFENVVGSMGIFQFRQPLLKNFWIDSTRLQIYIDKQQIRISEQDLRSQL